MITCIQIPISNYYEDGVFFKSLYFEKDYSSPSLEEVLTEICKLKDEQDVWLDKNEVFVVCHELLQCIQILENCKDFPRLGVNMRMTNTFIDHPKWGRQPITVTQIDLIRIP